MKKPLLLLAVCLIALLGGVTAVAQPKIHQFQFSDGAIVQKLSDNGQWGVMQASNDDALESGQARLVNMATDEVTVLQTSADVVAVGAALAKDVTDDGSIVVGQYKKQPAYWSKADGQWHQLDTIPGCGSGVVFAVTPDGKYGVGSCTYTANEYTECGVMWELATGEVVPTDGVPEHDMTNQNQKQVRFTDISPDGTKIVMRMSFSHLMPIAICVWVYDVETWEAKAIGYEVNNSGPWKAKVPNLYFVDEPTMSPNGKWVATNNYVINADSTAFSEVPGLYNVETDEFVVFNDKESDGMLTTAVDDYGCVYGATPKGNPIRNWAVRHGKYWFDINSILLQHYNFSIANKTGYENTGTPFSVSGDGKRLAVMTDPQYGEGYVIDVPEKLTTLCETVNLLGNYTVTPASGSVFSKIRSVSVLFDRNVQVKADASAIVLKNVATGEEVREAAAFQVDNTDPQNLIITFMPTTLEEGQKYSIEIPAGSICIAGDEARVNNAITIEYTGRANKAVTPKSIYPADGSEIARIDNETSNITISFDSEIAVADGASAQLVNLSDGSKQRLNLLAVGEKLAVYPASAYVLYKGLQYQVVVAAGSVTDITGNGACAEIVINYTGTYEPEISTDNENVFIETFQDPSTAYNNLMRYEGDHLTPAEEMADIEFDADNTPWIFNLRDAETSENYFAGSHSMYDPAGKSNDWMVSPQLYLPDAYCYLSFKAQNYKNRSKDMLTVIILQSDTIMYTLNANAISKFEQDGKVVFREQLTPGSDGAELTDNGWADYKVDLAEYAGKNIYVAFLNDNENQSAIFVDSIVVKRNLKFLVGLSDINTVVNKESVEIKGRVTANSDDETFSNVKAVLYDHNGNMVDEFSKTGLSLKKGDAVDFAFSKPLPLTVGVENEFKVAVTVDGYANEAKGKVKNLAYQTTKRVVLEEMTGTTCVNCPRGILAIENLEKLYHDQFIPISIHTYAGDALNTGQDGYMAFLGLSAAPSGIVQRSGIISSPMGEDFFTGETTFANGYTLWADYVAKELQNSADADINATVTVNEAANTYSVPVSVKYALNAKNLNLNLFLAVLEDDVVSFQQSNVGGQTEPIFGEWGAGGRYSAAVNYNVSHKDVVRSTMNAYNGFGGYLPQTVEAGKEYTATLGEYELPGVANNVNRLKAVVMLIDANNGKLINAVCAKFPGYNTGIDDVQTDLPAHALTFADGCLLVAGEGAATVQVYSMSGTLLGQAKGNGAFSVPMNRFNGGVIVKVTGAGKTTVKKFFVGK